MAAGEQELIRRIVELFGAAEAVVGIGDDAAVFRPPELEVVTADLLIEGVDFTRAVPLRFVGWKALAVNLSDLAAMGAAPERFVLSLGVPADLLGSIEALLEGMADLARRHRVSLVGGDLSAARDLTVSITAFGAMRPGASPLRRSGAQEGEGLFISRPLGAASAGLALLARGWRLDARGGATPPADLPVVPGFTQREFAASVLRRHVAPEPEIELGLRLSQPGCAGACIDVSDGLSTDLHRICSASAAGAVIEWERLPRFPDLERVGVSLGLDPEASVLHGGEEFSLLFTSRLRESELSSRLGRPVYRIGSIVRGGEVILRRGGAEIPLAAGGFDHFRPSS